MVLYQADPDPIPDDNTTAYTASTPPETVFDDFLNDDDPLSAPKRSSTSAVPWPGSTFMIRDVSTGNVITLLAGQVVLAPPTVRGGAIYWLCVETKGWLGFRNLGSGMLLGHDSRNRLCCVAERQQWWENFCVRLRPDGGYVLLMTHYSDTLWRVGMTVDQGVEKLAKIGDGGVEGIVWEFVTV